MDAWQADFRQFARRIEIAGERVRPWMVLVSSRTHDLVLAHALTEQAPSPEELWDLVAAAMERPAAGEPHRPTELQIRPDSTWDALTNDFDAIGVSCQPSEVLDQVDFLFDDLNRHMTGDDPPGLLDMPGVQPDQVGRILRGRRRVLPASPLAVARLRSRDPRRVRPIRERPLVRRDHGAVGPDARAGPL